jgi:hypothetical protein
MTLVARVAITCLRAVRDSMLVAWLILGAFALSIVFSLRAGLMWRTGGLLLILLPVVVHIWARALALLENRGTADKTTGKPPDTTSGGCGDPKPDQAAALLKSASCALSARLNADRDVQRST